MINGSYYGVIFNCFCCKIFMIYYTTSSIVIIYEYITLNILENSSS